MTCKSVRSEKPLFQWDVNQYLLVQDADYVYYQINGDIYRVRVEEGKCLIPDELLQTGGMKTVWACTDTGTRVAHTFGVQSRPIPPDYVSTPTERLTFDKLVEKVEDAVSEADEATDKAIKATKYANETAADIRNKAENGWFDGKPGAPGEPGKTTYIENPYNDTELRTEISKKVGYSEVSDGKLLMYADESKAVLLAEMDLPVYDDSDIRSELADKVDDVQVNGSSIVSGGVANIPIVRTLTPNVAGAILLGAGFWTGSDGKTHINGATVNDINSRSGNAIIRADSIDNAVRLALTDGKGHAYTDAEQLAARQRIGIDKPWVLKATINNENKDKKIAIDLSGCSELCVVGSFKTNAGTIVVRNQNATYLFALPNTSSAVRYVSCRAEDGVKGINWIYVKYGTNQTAIASNASGYDWLNNLMISSINYLDINRPEYVEDINLEIYAR